MKHLVPYMLQQTRMLTKCYSITDPNNYIFAGGITHVITLSVLFPRGQRAAWPAHCQPLRMRTASPRIVR